MPYVLVSTDILLNIEYAARIMNPVYHLLYLIVVRYLLILASLFSIT